MIPAPAPKNWTAIGIIVGVCIAVVGWFVNDWLNRRRERQRDQKIRSQTLDDTKAERRRTFLAWTERWRDEVKSRYAHNSPFLEIYFDRTAKFREQAMLIADDFGTRKADFEQVVSSACVFKKAQKEGEQHPDKEAILNAIDEVIRFVRDT